MSKLLLAVLVVAAMGAGVYFTGAHTKASPNVQPAVTAASASSVASQEQGQDIERVESQADFAKLYNSYEDLAQNAEIIVVGNVLETKSVDYTPQGLNEAQPQTVSYVKVTKSFNSNAKEGDLLTFVEAGGVTTKKAVGLDKKVDLPKEKWNDKIQIDFNGVPAMKPTETVLLFGVKPQSDFRVIDEPYYYVLGAHQGKFLIKGNSVERAVPGHMKDELNPLSAQLSDLDVKLKGLAAKQGLN
ncbi:hypothetical protein [Tumebacillus permanentifrigoris]|uniref:Uncharacterized protein n=1 Tax=Tumebacillus permanentifrigoris TaxID=378543 RepID=A0A316DAV8_9BACL|nr:hypothetical protein [Tumebacillus permanentifrigoris]PWK14942.1 hypothetical protein C7459_104145 [Tumebacillus permanentifrigoris]